MGGGPYRNFKMDEQRDRACALLGITGVGKSSFINSITKTKECEVGKKSTSVTSKIKVIQKLFNGKNYYFIDTPGLDDGKGDKSNISELEKLRDYPRISTLLICFKYNDVRLTDSIKKTLKKIMDIFPAQNFWDHVIIIRTWCSLTGRKLERYKNDYKGEIVNGIKNDNELCQYMMKKNITLPSNLKEFYVDCDPYELEDNTLQEFEKLLDEIKNKYPIYQDIKFDKEEEFVNEIEENGSKFLKIITQRKITFTDFNNKSHEIIEIVNNEVYNLEGNKPIFIFKRVQDDKPRGILCWKDQFKTHYNVVKIYEISHERKRVEYEYEFRYEKKGEEDQAKGEEYRDYLQNKFNETCDVA